MPRPVIKYPFNNEPRQLCQYGCGRIIYFVRTNSGAAMPVDYDTRETHFAHCPPYMALKRKQKEQSK